MLPKEAANSASTAEVLVREGPRPQSTIGDERIGYMMGPPYPRAAMSIANLTRSLPLIDTTLPTTPADCFYNS